MSNNHGWVPYVQWFYLLENLTNSSSRFCLFELYTKLCFTGGRPNLLDKFLPIQRFFVSEFRVWTSHCGKKSVVFDCHDMLFIIPLSGRSVLIRPFPAENPALHTRFRNLAWHAIEHDYRTFQERVKHLHFRQRFSSGWQQVKNLADTWQKRRNLLRQRGETIIVTFMLNSGMQSYQEQVSTCL